MMAHSNGRPGEPAPVGTDAEPAPQANDQTTRVNAAEQAESRKGG